MVRSLVIDPEHLNWSELFAVSDILCGWREWCLLAVNIIIGCHHRGLSSHLTILSIHYIDVTSCTKLKVHVCDSPQYHKVRAKCLRKSVQPFSGRYVWRLSHHGLWWHKWTISSQGSWVMMSVWTFIIPSCNLYHSSYYTKLKSTSSELSQWHNINIKFHENLLIEVSIVKVFTNELMTGSYV